MRSTENNMSKHTFGVLLTDEGWFHLDDVLKDYIEQGDVGKYLSCSEITTHHQFVLLTFEKTKLVYWIHAHLIKVIAVWSEEPPIGFCFQDT